jgi:hypothetical protein
MRQAEIAVMVTGRYWTLITPEEVNPRPLHLRGKLTAGEDGKNQTWRSAAGQDDIKPAASRDCRLSVSDK